MDKNAKNTANTNTDNKLIHTFEEKAQKYPSTKKYYIVGLLIILLGLGTGLILSKNKSSSISSGSPLSTSKQVVGSKDTSLFKDMAEGKLEKGGIDGEGTHKLIRPGGESQTVYLTSAVLDLEPFVGKKIRIWGKTYAAQKAGWLMDIGRVEVLQ